MTEEHRTMQINGVDADGVPYTFRINGEALLSGNIHNGDAIDFVVGQAATTSRAAHSFVHPDLYSFIGGAALTLVVVLIVVSLIARRDESDDAYFSGE